MLTVIYDVSMSILHNTHQSHTVLIIIIIIPTNYYILQIVLQLLYKIITPRTQTERASAQKYLITLCGANSQTDKNNIDITLFYIRLFCSLLHKSINSYHYVCSQLIFIYLCVIYDNIVAGYDD